MRTNYPSGSKWEDAVGYSRIVKVGNILEVAGTTSSDAEGTIHGVGDAYQQTKYIIQKIESHLQKAGASLSDVVRTRIFATDISNWAEIGRAHGEFFRDIKPASSMVEVSRLIDPELLVEIEMTAIIT